MKNFLILLLIFGSLASCAPSMQASTPVVDPIFAPGQIWQVMWTADDITKFIVPPRDTTSQSDSSYESSVFNYAKRYTQTETVKYSPARSSPEFIFFKRVYSIEDVIIRSRFCFVRNPGVVAIGTSLTGVFSTSSNPDMETYLKTGVADLPPCSLKRLK